VLPKQRYGIFKKKKLNRLKQKKIRQINGRKNLKKIEQSLLLKHLSSLFYHISKIITV